MTQKPSGIGPQVTHAGKNEIVCDGRAIKYNYTGPISSGRKYIPHSQSQTNVSICMYTPHGFMYSHMCDRCNDHTRSASINHLLLFNYITHNLMKKTIWHW